MFQLICTTVLYGVRWQAADLADIIYNNTSQQHPIFRLTPFAIISLTCRVLPCARVYEYKLGGWLCFAPYTLSLIHI